MRVLHSVKGSMALLSLQNISLAFGGEPLLDSVTLNIEKGDHICLVGRNGSGKSSLLKVISGELEPDSGDIVRSPKLRVVSLPQDVPTDISGTVKDVVLAVTTDEPVAMSAISRLGLNPDDNFASLSGGQRRRCLLARALASQPDILVLDEPTNHLDIASIEWLEEYLKNRVPTFIFVTHDRTFLRHLAIRIIDLDRGKLNGWDCDYDTFLKRKQQVLEDEEVVYARMGKLLKKEEAWLRRGVKARTTRNEGRVRALMDLRARFAERRVEEGNSKFEIRSSERSGARAMRIKDLTFAYDGWKNLIENFSLDILRGERIGVIGSNGTGKSTFVKLLMGELTPTAGEVVQGTNLQIIYFDQLRSQLKPGLSVADNVADGRDTVSVAGTSRHILAYLGDFLFSPERARTPVKALSGGERSRVLLARLFLNAGNMLILDEPTNDLDVETLDLLEEQIAAFDGTVIIISHDRAFLDNVVTSTLYFGDDGIKQYPGGYSDCEAAIKRLQKEKAKAKRGSLSSASVGGAAGTPHSEQVRWGSRLPCSGGLPSRQPLPRTSQNSQLPTPNSPPKTEKPKRLSYNEKREYEGLPAKIEALEKEESELNARLSDPDIYKEAASDIKAWQARLDTIPAELESLLERLIALEERV